MAADPPDDTAETERTGLSRVVVWLGIVFGTAFAILMLTNGITPPQIGGMPSWLGIILGGLIAYLLVIVITTTLTELTRRHHKTARQAAGRGLRSAGSRAHAAAQRRWQAHHESGHSLRGGIVRVLRVIFQPGEPGSDDAQQPASKPAGESTGKIPSTSTNPGGTPAAKTSGGTPMAGNRPSRISPQRRAHRTTRMIDPANVPTWWRPVITAAADFEPESDEHLLEWMIGEIMGAAGYAEALIEAYETGTLKVGIDPQGLQVLHDVADAQAQAAQTMGAAKKKFLDHYELPREFAANGGLMTLKGRWITGQGG